MAHSYDMKKIFYKISPPELGFVSAPTATGLCSCCGARTRRRRRRWLTQRSTTYSSRCIRHPCQPIEGSLAANTSPNVTRCQCYKTFFPQSLILCTNKLECVYCQDFFKATLMLEKYAEVSPCLQILEYLVLPLCCQDKSA